MLAKIVNECTDESTDIDDTYRHLFTRSEINVCDDWKSVSYGDTVMTLNFGSRENITVDIGVFSDVFVFVSEYRDYIGITVHVDGICSSRTIVDRDDAVVFDEELPKRIRQSIEFESLTIPRRTYLDFTLMNDYPFLPNQIVPISNGLIVVLSALPESFDVLKQTKEHVIDVTMTLDELRNVAIDRELTQREKEYIHHNFSGVENMVQAKGDDIVYIFNKTRKRND